MLPPSRLALFLLALYSVACTGVVDAKDEAGDESSLSSRRRPGRFAVAALPDLAPAPDPAPGTNLLVNGGFEDDLAGWTWSLNASAVAAQPRSGARALEVGPAAGGIGQDLVGKLSPGVSYHLECYARVGDAAEWSAIMLQLTNAAGAIVLGYQREAL